uniref:LAGLIDADG endonuclease n=1 Tax=Juglanconis juglandina TaxID=1940567 RepID=A0A291LJF1_9PEZI|nr:hypothetical protein [Juglanconis juglandina]
MQLGIKSFRISPEFGNWSHLDDSLVRPAGFTVTWWFTITSNFLFKQPSFRLQSIYFLSIFLRLAKTRIFASLCYGICGTSIIVVKFHLVFFKQNLNIIILYHFRFKFIPSAIIVILFNPSIVKCSLFLINSATLHQSSKSNAFTPRIGYSLKKGIIIFSTSLWLLICNKQVLFLSEQCTVITLLIIEELNELK